ncbi:MAG: hypothetical protein ACI861_000332 [Paracoccaceae bacterium]
MVWFCETGYHRDQNRRENQSDHPGAGLSTLFGIKQPQMAGPPFISNIKLAKTGLHSTAQAIGSLCLRVDDGFVGL